MLGEGDAEAAARSASALTQWTRAHPSDSLTTARAIAHFYTGLWAFQQGDTATVERSMKALLALKPPAESPSRRSQSVLFEQLLGAHLALARKAPDLKARLSQVDSLLIDTRPQDRRLSRLVGNMLVADLWERVGEPERALAANHRRVGQYGLAMLAPARQGALSRGTRHAAQWDHDPRRLSAARGPYANCTIWFRRAQTSANCASDARFR